MDTSERKTAIRVQNLKKVYKLYDKPHDRFKEAVGLTEKRLRSIMPVRV